MLSRSVIIFSRLFSARQRGLKPRWLSSAGNSSLSQSMTPAEIAFASKIRNVGIVAHIDAGKTTTTEHILYVTGKIDSVGRVDRGDTVMDFLPQEKERGITIASAAITCHWKQHTINIIDTPGHVDFSVEVELATRVLDGCVLLVDAVAGVQCQTKSVWRRLSNRHLPAIAFVNKMDRIGASLNNSLASMQRQLGVSPLCLHQPLYDTPVTATQDEVFIGYVDLISRTRFTWPHLSNTKNATTNTHSNSSSSNNGNINMNVPRVSAVLPTDMDYAEIEAQREQLLENLTSFDDIFLEKYLSQTDDEVLSIDEVVQALRRVTLQRKVLPVFCGATLKGIGTQALLDGVTALLPSPLDLYQPFPTTFTASSDSNINNSEKNATSGTTSKSLEAALLVFKVVQQAGRGLVAYARVLEGRVAAGHVLRNISCNQDERVNQLLAPMADSFSALDQQNNSATTNNNTNVEDSVAGAGSIVCLSGLRHSRAGDLLVSRRDTLLLRHMLANNNSISSNNNNDKNNSSSTMYNSMSTTSDDDTVEAVDTAATDVNNSSNIKQKNPNQNQKHHQQVQLLHQRQRQWLQRSRVSVPPPVFSISLEAHSSSQQEQLERALSVLCREDPSLQVCRDTESGQMVLRGLGELHCEVAVDRLQRQHRVSVTPGKTYVACRETLRLGRDVSHDTLLDTMQLQLEEGNDVDDDKNNTKSEPAEPTDAVHDHDGNIHYEARYERVLEGGKRLFAAFTLVITPLASPTHALLLAAPATYSIAEAVSDTLSAAERDAVTDTLNRCFERGPRGYPVTGLRVSVTHIARDGVNTTPGAIRACLSSALHTLLSGNNNASHNSNTNTSSASSEPLLLEPVMRLEVSVPLACVGAVVSDLTAKRRALQVQLLDNNNASADSSSSTVTNAHKGVTDGRSQVEEEVVVEALAPLAAVLGYASALRSLTKGEGSFSAEYLCHLPVLNNNHNSNSNSNNSK